MSHFITVCLLPPNTKPSQFEAKIAKLIAPYDENKRGPSRLEKCYCVGNKASSEVAEQANAKFGGYDDLREKLQEMTKGPEFQAPPYPPGTMPKAESKPIWDAIQKVEKARQKVWDSLRRPREKFEEKALAKHPLRNKADKDCDECKGKGKRKTTYNKKSKWDWWIIGGRWPDYFNFGDYDPFTDPDNIEDCNICGATGKRRPPPACGPGDQPCNGCDGKGKRLKFSLKPTHTSANVSDLLIRWKSKETRKVPFAIVDPSGRWAEKGEMGWWACVSNEKKTNDWEKQVKAIYERYPRHIAVAVDMHI
jgi:hypothetical protein